MILPPGFQHIRLYGIGHAMVDLYAVLPSHSVLPFPLKAGEAVHLDEKAMDRLVEKVRELCKDDQSKVALFCKTAGGTVVNILRTASRLDTLCFFSGSTGMDEDGKRDKDAHFFQKECAKAKVSAHLVSQSGHTGRCLIAYTEDSTAKAIAASPSVARSITLKQVHENEIKCARCVVIEGMIFFNAPVIDRILELCKKHSKPLAVDLASCFVATHAVSTLAHAVKSNSLLAQHLLVFANEQEYMALCDTAQIEMSYLLQHGALIIEKRSEKGARLYWNDKVLAETAEVQAVEDDTGAGDAFAGGFLCHFLAHSASPHEQNNGCADEQILRDCLKAGNATAATVLAQYGCTV